MLDGRAVTARGLAADVLGLAAAGEVLGLEVADVEEAVLALAEVDEGGLDGGLDVGDDALVDVADVAEGGGAFDVEFLKLGFLEHGDAALVALGHVDEHDLVGDGAEGLLVLDGDLFFEQHLGRGNGGFDGLLNRRLGLRG